MVQITSKKWAIILFISIALNIFLGSVLVADKFFKEQRHAFRGMVYSVPWAVKVIGKEVRSQARENFMARRDRVRRNRQTIQQSYSGVNQALSADPFNRDALSASLADLRSKSLRRQELIHNSMVDFAAGLSGDQRMELANSVDKWMERRSRRFKRRMRHIENK